MCIYIYCIHIYIYIYNIYIYIYWVYHGFAHWNNSFGASGSNKLLTKEARDLVNCSIKPSKFWANNFEEPLDGFIMFYPQMNTHDGWNRRLQVQTHVYIYIYSSELYCKCQKLIDRIVFVPRCLTRAHIMGSRSNKQNYWNMFVAVSWKLMRFN